VKKKTKKNNQLRSQYCDSQQKLRKLNNDYDRMKNSNDRMTEEKNMLEMENGKLKEHIDILTRQNQELNNEIENVLKEDEHMKEILNRNDRISSLLNTNNSIICQMPQDELNVSSACFDEKRTRFCPDDRFSMTQSQSFGRDRTFSPKYTYSRTGFC
jgi:regulator of replication initiation timing